MHSIPELSARQEAYLQAAIDDPTNVIGLVEPEAHEQTKVAVRRAIGLHDMKGLIRLGLMEDVSHKFQNVIDSTFEREGRTMRLFLITKLGVQMFEDANDRLSN